MRSSNIIFIIMLCLILIFSGCSKAADRDAGIIPSSNDSLQEIQPEVPQVEQVKEVNQAMCSLTGLPIENKDQDLVRPIAVMIDNMANARPQSGLISADIVYEMPAEGGITRYMAIYHHQISDKIGPVRSARSYFIDKAIEYNAVFVHCGGSPQALRDIVDLKVDSLNELKGETNFWRARDRKPPHNLYTSTALINDLVRLKKLSDEPWSYKMSFNEEFLQPGGKVIKGLVIDYKHNYEAGYEYDVGKKLFYRTINGVRLKDKETDKEVTAVNIIVERVAADVIDDVGRLDLSNIGKGRGYLITGGELIEIEWTKESRRSMTSYTDLKGSPIQINKGNTWIQVVPEYATIEIKE